LFPIEQRLKIGAFDQLCHQVVVSLDYKGGVDERNRNSAITKVGQNLLFILHPPMTISAIPTDFASLTSLFQYAEARRIDAQVDGLINAAFASLAQSSESAKRRS
jgi:hypothetical protein